MFLLFAGGKFFIVLVSLPTDDQCFHHIKNSQLICSANRFTGLCILVTLILEKENAAFIAVNRFLLNLLLPEKEFLMAKI